MKLNSLSALASLIIASTSLIPQTLANTEKVIFRAPGPDEKTRFDAPGTDDVSQHTVRQLAWYLADLPKLTHENFTIRTDIERGFSNDSFPSGPETWMLLDGLKPGKSYEARVCWAATQPTSFGLDAFNLTEVMEDKEELFPSLTASFNSRLDPNERFLLRGFQDTPASRMLLRIQAKADYFTEDEAAMSRVPPVVVHVILDPLHFNFFPHSMALFGLYLMCTVIAVVSFMMYTLGAKKVQAIKSKGAAIMNEITLGEADRDGYTSSMDRKSEDTDDRETGDAGRNGGNEGASRGMSRGRRASKFVGGSWEPEVQEPREPEAAELVEPEAQGHGVSGAPGRGVGKGAKKSRPRRKK